MKRPRNMTHMLHPRGRLCHVLVMTLSEIYSHKTCNSRPSPLFKLCYRCSLESRQKFNLIVSAETLVSKHAERIGISLNGNLRSGGGLLKYYPTNFGHIS